MNNRLEKYIQCPLCKSSLKKTGYTLSCSKTKHIFKIEQGIPVLLNYPSLHRHSQKQQFHFEKTMNKLTLTSFSNMNQWKRRYLERFVDCFEKMKNKSVIEVGTGGGYMAIGLAKLGARVIATDLTLKNLVVLKRLSKSLGLESNLAFTCCSADQLPFKNGVFDYFVLNSVLEHVPTEAKAISEIKRTLKIGGGLMITVPTMYKYIFPLLIPINLFHDRRIGHLRRYSDISLISKFRDFRIKKIYFTGHPLKVIKTIINMIIKIFDELEIEKEDEKFIRSKVWSSNIIAFFIKK